ncbi:hypothetical protein Q5P01_002988 [Channa striata]|uniref:Immunoglobulin domain-containing protein n=1 Tax=Channa striata TaxID=64152 RepID=A0AA88NQC5_CHASR|nr:hypothetical protein Q5P01_002988 [Channa striata]
MSVPALFVGLVLRLLPAVSAEVNITAEPGQNVTLPFHAPSNIDVLGVRCSNPDLGEEYMFYYQDKQSSTEYQHHTFWNRVTLEDNRIKGGHLSVILENVRLNETGTYACKIIDTQKKRWETVFNLTVGYEFVTLPDHTAGNSAKERNKAGEKKDGDRTIADDMRLAGVRVEDAQDRVKWKRMIRCGDP